MTGKSFVLGSHTECARVCACVSDFVIKCNNHPLHLQWARKKRLD